MAAFLSKWGALCGSISAIIALILVFYKPIKKHIAARKAKRKTFEDSVLQGITDIKNNLTSLTDDVAELQREALTQAHAIYMQQGWCSSERKKVLCAWKKSYTDKGYDHLINTYEEDILALPETPPVSKR